MNITINEKNLEHLFTQSADKLLEILSSFKNEKIVVGLCGGRSIVKLLEKLLTSAEANKNLFAKMQFFLIDERLVGIRDKDSNYNLLYQEFFLTLLEKLIIKEEQIHPFTYDKANPGLALEKYTSEFKTEGGKFDLVVFGAGEDGHVASLFPNHPSIQNNNVGYIEVSNSPKPPANRISASKAMLEKTELAVAMFLGEAKQQAYRNYLNPNIAVEECPVKIVNTAKNQIIVTDL
ncbi:MAG: 6-phosphogluconolactonase [Proteobacteria bacterium]|nr:6-phosphogluconolactonase [Pseudomonadota bacterium]